MLLAMLSVTVVAEEASIQDQIIEFKNRIEELEKSNEQLRAEITNKDEEVMRMKQQLQELEEKIRNN
jgi:prefoldin subunit 5